MSACSPYSSGLLTGESRPGVNNVFVMFGARAGTHRLLAGIISREQNTSRSQQQVQAVTALEPNVFLHKKLSKTMEKAGVPYRRPFVKYTPTWPRSFMPQDQSIRNMVAKMKLIPIRGIPLCTH